MREYTTFTCSIDGLLQRQLVPLATLLRISTCGFVAHNGANASEALAAALRGMEMLLAHKQAPRLVYFLPPASGSRTADAVECPVSDAEREEHANVVHSALVRAGYALLSEADLDSLPLPGLQLDMQPSLPVLVYLKFRVAKGGEVDSFPYIASGARYPGEHSAASYLQFSDPANPPYPFMMVPGSGYEINTRLNCSTLVNEAVAVIMPGFVKQASKDHGQKVVWLPPNYGLSLHTEYTLMVSLVNSGLLADEASAPVWTSEAPIVVYATFPTKIVSETDFNDEIDELSRCAYTSGDGLQTAVADGKTRNNFTIRLFEHGDVVPDGYHGCPKLLPCQSVFSIRLEGPSLVAPAVECEADLDGNLYRVSYTLAEAGSYDLQVSLVRVRFVNDSDRRFSSGDQVESFIIPPTTVDALDGNFEQPFRICSASEVGVAPGRWVHADLALGHNYSGYTGDDDSYMWIPFTCMLRSYAERHVQRCAQQHRRERGHPLHLILMGNSQMLSTWMDLHAEMQRTRSDETQTVAGGDLELDMYPTMKDGTWRVKGSLPHCQSACLDFKNWYSHMYQQLNFNAHNSTFLVTNFAVAVPDTAECLRDHVLPSWRNFKGNLVLRLGEKVHVQNAPDAWRFRRKALTDAHVVSVKTALREQILRQQRAGQRAYLVDSHQITTARSDKCNDGLHYYLHEGRYYGSSPMRTSLQVIWNIACNDILSDEEFAQA